MSRVAYVDSSCIVAIALGEPNARGVATRLRGFDSLISHPLLDAEVRSACAREGVAVPYEELAFLGFVEAKRSVSNEIDAVLAGGYVRGADCLHLATALYLSPDPRQITFFTLDLQQRAVARRLGVKV